MAATENATTISAGEWRTFDEFWPFYVAAHSRRATRLFHLAGTALGAATVVTAAVRHKPGLLPAAPVFGYGLAWFSHFVIEKNKPATFGHPLWSFAGDWKMIANIVTGHDEELNDIAIEYKASHPEA